MPIAFVLARLMYGPRVALAIAALIALHPMFIDLSTTAESETVYRLIPIVRFTPREFIDAKSRTVEVEQVHL